MDIQAEKLYLIEKLARLDDEAVLQKVKELLQDTVEEDALMLASIQRGIEQSKSGHVRPHGEVMQEMCSKYGS